jgi:hypothetical protein
MFGIMSLYPSLKYGKQIHRAENLSNSSECRRPICPSHRIELYKRMLCAGFLEQSMGARNRVGIGLSYQPARILYSVHRPAGRCDSSVLTQFLAPIDFSKISALVSFPTALNFIEGRKYNRGKEAC